MANVPLIIALAENLDHLLSAATNIGGVGGYDFGYGDYPYQLQDYQPHLRVTIPTGGRLNERQRKQTLKRQSNIGKEGFQISMDVQQFKPNELTVKTVDNYIVVEGKHEEREDEHGFISRHFVRKYLLPKGYDPAQAISTLSSDGVLTVKIPNSVEQNNERVVPIQQTGPAHLSVKDNEKEEDAKKEGDGDKKD